MAINTSEINQFLKRQIISSGFSGLSSGLSTSGQAQASKLEQNISRQSTNANEKLSKATSGAAEQMLKFGKIMAGLKIAGAALIAVNEKALQGRLRDRGDFAQLAQRELGPSIGARIASSLGFGFIAQLERQQKERTGLVDAAKVAELLAGSFQNLKASVDANASSLASQQLAVKFRFNPEELAHQLRLQTIKEGPQQKAKDIRNILASSEAEVKRLQDSPIKTASREGTLAEVIERKNALRTKRSQIKAAQDRVAQIKQDNLPEAVRLEKLAEGQIDISAKRFDIDQLVGTKPVSVSSFGSLGVSTGGAKAGKADPIVQFAEIRNTLLRRTNEILLGIAKAQGLNP